MDTMLGCYHDACGCAYSALTGKLTEPCRQHRGMPLPPKRLPFRLEQDIADALFPFIELYNSGKKQQGQ